MPLSFNFWIKFIEQWTGLNWNYFLADSKMSEPNQLYLILKKWIGMNQMVLIDPLYDYFFNTCRYTQNRNEPKKEVCFKMNLKLNFRIQFKQQCTWLILNNFLADIKCFEPKQLQLILKHKRLIQWVSLLLGTTIFNNLQSKPNLNELNK